MNSQNSSNSSVGVHNIEQFNPNEFWGGITDPNHHDAKSFRYLVHGFNPFAGSLTKMSMIGFQHEAGVKTDKAFGDQSINLEQSPERLGERVSLSMSLIDQNHMQTWGAGGLIVGALPGSIVAVDNQDIGTQNFHRDELIANATNKIRYNSGSELLQDSRVMNEVVALGTDENGKHPILLGFFAKWDEEDGYKDKYIGEKMEAHARRLGLPFIKMQDPYPKDSVIENENGIYVYIRGIQYSIRKNIVGFFRHSRMSKQSIMRLDELETMYQFIQKNHPDYLAGFGDLEQRKLELAKVRQDFFSPKLEKNDTIALMVGEGTDALKYTLHKKGIAYKIHQERASEAIRKSMSGNLGMSTYDRGGERNGYLQIGKSEVEMIIGRAIGEMPDGEEKQKVMDFYNEVYSIIQEPLRLETSLGLIHSQFRSIF